MPPSITECPLKYEAELESAISEIESLLGNEYALSPRAMALLLLQDVQDAFQQLKERQGEAIVQEVVKIQQRLRNRFGDVEWYLAKARQQQAREIAQAVITQPSQKRVRTLADRIGWLCMNPLTGFPILAFVLYLGLYQFVGVFGGGTVVDYLENTLFGTYMNPAISRLVETLLPWPTLQALFVGEYGVWTLGVTYALALILPIVTFFFLVFAVLEDTGYLPRLAMLLDRSFKKLGLNGRAVIPVVLGFGCDTMATVVTRILETRRERVLTTFLLGLTIPCSAQLGVVLALLAAHPRGLLIWVGVLVAVFLLAGYLAAKVLPGTPAPFYMEIPPMRLPSWSNVIAKTLARLHWYFREVFPLFLLASVVIWIGQLTKLFDLALQLLTPIVQTLDLPAEAAVAFLFGFFRRDYGAAGLYQLNDQHLMTGNQLLIASVVLTLFLPCVAQFLVTIKERGIKMAISMAVFTFVFALLVGFLLSRTLIWLGVQV